MAFMLEIDKQRSFTNFAIHFYEAQYLWGVKLRKMYKQFDLIFGLQAFALLVLGIKFRWNIWIANLKNSKPWLKTNSYN